MNLLNNVAILMSGMILLTPYRAHATELDKLTTDTVIVEEKEDEKVEEVDWKTAIPMGANIDKLFKDEYDEEKILYTTTYLNLREFPNTECGKVKVVLNPNVRVRAIADYNGWTKIVRTYENGETNYYYMWNEYLSEERIEIEDSDNGKNDNGKNKSSKSNGSSSESSGKEYLGKFKLTGYCNCSSCCGEWADGVTASGKYPVEGRTVAMYGVPLGTKLLINGNVYIVEDRGTPYGHIDMYFNSHSEALDFGVQYADVYRLN